MSILSLLPNKPKQQNLYMLMILNYQKKSSDYEKSNERGVVISFGSNFGRRASCS
jgi:hypothetical protein